MLTWRVWDTPADIQRGSWDFPKNGKDIEVKKRSRIRSVPSKPISINYHWKCSFLCRICLWCDFLFLQCCTFGTDVWNFIDTVLPIY